MGGEAMSHPGAPPVHEGMYITVTVIAAAINGIAAVTYLVCHDYP